MLHFCFRTPTLLGPQVLLYLIIELLFLPFEFQTMFYAVQIAILCLKDSTGSLNIL